MQKIIKRFVSIVLALIFVFSALMTVSAAISPKEIIKMTVGSKTVKVTKLNKETAQSLKSEPVMIGNVPYIQLDDVVILGIFSPDIYKNNGFGWFFGYRYLYNKTEMEASDVYCFKANSNRCIVTKLTPYDAFGSGDVDGFKPLFSQKMKAKLPEYKKGTGIYYDSVGLQKIIYKFPNQTKVLKNKFMIPLKDISAMLGYTLTLEKKTDKRTKKASYNIILKK